MKKNAEPFDQKQFADNFKKGTELIYEGLIKIFSGISPNKIDLNKLKGLIANGKPLKDYERDGTILINLNGPRSARIESIYEGHKIFKSAITSLMEAGFIASENNGGILINLPQITEEVRKDIVKQIKTNKENAKNRINELRGDFHKQIKTLTGVSEDLQHSLRNEIDKIKDTYQAKLENEFIRKENEVMKG